METLKFILEKYNLQPRRMPCEIPNMGRENLPELFNELGFKTGAEIGVYKGEFSTSLCKGIPDLKLYAIDSWAIYFPDYRDYKDQRVLDNGYEIAVKTLKKYNVDIVRAFSMDAVKTFRDGSLDFVYIDANHEYPFVTNDIIHWSKKVRPGGIVAGHDYYESKSKSSRCHVIPAICGYARAYKIFPWFVIGTKAMPPGVIRDRSRSWMFVKE